MIRRFILISLITVVACAVSSCSTNETPASKDVVSQDHANVNAALEDMARLVAKSTNRAEARRSLKGLAVQRFSGDTEVLYKTFAKQKLSSGITLRELLATEYHPKSRQGSDLSLTAKVAEIETLAAQIPNFQIAVRGDVEAWNADTYAPLVAYDPVGVDETSLKQIKAFDARGKMHLLDARKAPGHPVIVLGISERTDEKGQLLPEFEGSTDAQVSKAERGARIAVPEDRQDECRRVVINRVTLRDAHEPWFKGSPELYLQVKGHGSDFILYDGRFRDIEEGESETYNRPLFNWCPPDQGHTLGFHWYEKDGGTALKLVYTIVKGKIDLEPVVIESSVALEFEVKDEDDHVGTAGIGRRDGDIDNSRAEVVRDTGDILWTSWLEFGSPPPTVTVSCEGTGNNFFSCSASARPTSGSYSFAWRGRTNATVEPSTSGSVTGNCATGQFSVEVTVTDAQTGLTTSRTGSATCYGSSPGPGPNPEVP